MFTKNELYLKSIPVVYGFCLGGKTSAIMPKAEDKNREESMRCKWIRYPASPTLEADYALKFMLIRV